MRLLFMRLDAQSAAAKITLAAFVDPAGLGGICALAIVALRASLPLALNHPVRRKNTVHDLLDIEDRRARKVGRALSSCGG